MNTVRIGYAQNPDLKEIFARKNPGDEVNLTVTLVVKAVGPDEMTGSLTEVECPDDMGEGEGEADEPASDQTAEVTASSPASIVMNMGKTK